MALVGSYVGLSRLLVAIFLPVFGASALAMVMGLRGFWRAVTYGLNHMRGDACAIMMADASDSPEDAVKSWRLLNQGFDQPLQFRFLEPGQRPERQGHHKSKRKSQTPRRGSRGRQDINSIGYGSGHPPDN